MRNKISPIWRLSKDQFQSLIEKSNTIGQVLAYFGIENHGGNYKTFRRRCEQDGIDFSKFKGNFSKGGWTVVPLAKLLVVNSEYSRSSLKKRLIEEGLLKNECSCCGQQPIWNGQKLVMVLDHKNGINNDNRLENLRLLCPNCNSQTSTFAGRANLGKGKKHNCKKCGKKINKWLIHCKECKGSDVRIEQRKVERPSKEELENLLWEKPTTKLAQQFGVSDKAIEKWAKTYGIKKPPRGYWQKKASEDSSWLGNQSQFVMFVGLDNKVTESQLEL